MIRFNILFILTFLSIISFGQTGSITGVVKDPKTKETIVGANVIIKGTTNGSSTDFDGKYEIKNLAPGTYSLDITFISYKPLTIEKVKVQANKATTADIDLEQQAVSLGGVEVVGTKKTDTDVSLMNTIKGGDLVVTGISSQQISRSQDRDASEVVKRIPGVTIIDNRFIVVRGLNERYNVVWLNNASTPSSESDVKAFSFDVIPSSMLDRVLVFKTPAPELPADFAGGAIQIYTKNNVEKNFINVSFSESYRSGTTGKQFFRSKQGGKDWLGYDDGTRALPADFPDYKEMIRLSNSSLPEDKEKIKALGREMNKNWSAEEMTANPDLRFSLASGLAFKLKKRTLSNITSLNYSNTYNYQDIFRADYQDYDTIHDKCDTSYYFYDKQYTNTVKVGVLHNWSFSFNKNNKIEFRNLLNQNGLNRTTNREGRDNSGGSTIKAYEYKYMSRTTYSGQLGGDHTFGDNGAKLNWTLGYSYANKKEPDVKHLTLIKSEEDPDAPHYGDYAVQIPFAATPETTGRLYSDMYEKIYNVGANFEDKITLGNFIPTLKAGFYYETKNRAFNTRNIGYRVAKTSSFNWELPYMAIDSIFMDTNINNTNGIKLDEKTNASDSYEAANEIIAGYVSLKIPILTLFNVYAGVRVEKNIQTLNSFQIDDPTIPVNVKNDTLNFFPSASLTYDLTEKSLFRLAYGMTVNRPEFREIAPMLFYDFELKSGVRGNPTLKNAYIHNYDLRYEFYPSLSESILIGGFYKKFINPIESTVIPAGSGIDYSFTNADAAISYGAEIEIRKSFQTLGKKSNFLKYFKDFSIVCNGTYIKSEVQFNKTRLEENRPLQGQSPYIVNAGLFYQNDSIGLNVSVLYNLIGKRIVTVGNPYQNTPDIYELPRNLFDIVITKKIGKHIQIKASVQDLFNDNVIFRQTIKFNQDTNGDGIGDGIVERNQDMKIYSPGTYYSLGLTVNF
ncbi:MAG: TonB-dependent receptor [Bacteroidetes bacterium]|nr:TonB-dependent receptor [Bacteroidota bacterium]